MFLSYDDAMRVKQERMHAVRDAYWNSTPANAYEVWKLKQALMNANIVEEPTMEQIRAFFMMVPALVVFDALKWGFNDTDVERELYDFVLTNRASIQKALITIPSHTSDGAAA